MGSMGLSVLAVFALALHLSLGSVMDSCGSTGDTHVQAFSDVSPRNFDVMGDDDWVLAEGPDVDGVPKFQVHGVQKVWNRCGTDRLSVTVLKHLALQCGSFHILIDSTWALSGCEHNGLSSSDILNPRIFVKGVNSNTNRSYTGIDYLKDADFAPGSIIPFYDGTTTTSGKPNTGSINIKTSNCYQSDCNPNYGHVRVRIEVSCAGTSTETWIHPGGYGTFLQVAVRIPRDDLTKPIRVGGAMSRNLVGGYCGGWDDRVRSKFETLLKNCVSNKYYSAGCRPLVTAGVSTSLFALWEGWTKGAFDSRFSSDETADIAAEYEPINPVKWDKYWRICSDLGRQFLVGVKLTDKPTTPKEFILFATVKECAEDSYYGLIWTSDDFTNFFYKSISFRVNQERKDIFCAAKKLQQKGSDIDTKRDILPLIQDCKAPADTERLSVHMNAIADLASEVKSSSDNIVYWDVPLCGALIEPTPKDEMLGTNCDSWVFRDSLSVQDQAAFEASHSHVMSSTVKFTHNQGFVNAGKLFKGPVIFLGPPTFYGANQIVTRVNPFTNGDGSQFGVFAREPRCMSFSHPEETAAYIVLDTEFDYPEKLQVFTRTVTKDWGTISWDSNMGTEAIVFTTIQSSNNFACPTCTSKPGGVSGYVSVRIRNITPRSCEVKLEGDTSTTNALEPETVAFLVTREGAKGKIGTINYQAGVVQTGDSTGPSTGERPTTFQLVSGIAGFSLPNVLLSVISTSGSPDLPITLRDNSYADGVYKFQVDRDCCNSGLGKARKRGPERVAWIAFDRL